MLERLRELDQWLMLRLNRGFTCAFLDHTLPTVTTFAAWVPLLAVAAALLLWRGSFSVRAFIICAALAALLCEALVGGPLKKLAGRLRPFQVMPEIVKRSLPAAKPRMLALFRAPVIETAKIAAPGTRGDSLPSSHVVNMFAVTAVAFAFIGRWGWCVAGVAALVAGSRIYCGVHWPGDIALSAPLGLLCGWLFTRLASLLWRQHGARWFPAVHRAHPQLR
jgi:undecaprenyl-diphosphatase